MGEQYSQIDFAERRRIRDMRHAKMPTAAIAGAAGRPDVCKRYDSSSWAMKRVSILGVQYPPDFNDLTKRTHYWRNRYRALA